MYTWHPNTLCWSFSSSREFERCRRAYFFWRFWGQDPRSSYRIYKLRQLTTLPALRGEVVHTVIADALRMAKSGEIMDLDAAKDRVTEELRRRFIESAKRMWEKPNRPVGKKMYEFTSLAEHYYGEEDAKDKAREARQIAWKCLENLMGSELWSELCSSDPSNWVEIEEEQYHSFDLEGIQVHSRIDFAHTNGTPTIIDWKTGEPSEDDHRQLLVYALYAGARWEWDPLGTTLSAVYLHPEVHIDSFIPTADDLRGAEEMIKESFARMLEVEPTYGPADREQFPFSENPRLCAWCNYREICVGAKR
jgi:hypothetical protein